jgi:hypothetical protein
MPALDRYSEGWVIDDKLRRTGIWRWGVCGVGLWGIGSALMLRGSWYTASTATENVTFVVLNALIGAVLGLLAGRFALPGQRQDPQKPGRTPVVPGALSGVR